MALLLRGGKMMSESTLSAWSLSIHVPSKGGVGGDPFRSLCDLQYWRTSSRLVFEYIIFEWFGLQYSYTSSDDVREY